MRRWGLRPLEVRFRLRSSSYDPTSRLRFEAMEFGIGNAEN